MLDVFRSLAQSWVAKIGMLVIGLSFILWGVSGYLFNQGDATEVVAKVDGEKISSSLFQHRLQQAKEQYAHVFGSDTASKVTKTPAFAQQVLDSMIDDLLLAHQASKLHLQVPDSALSAKIVAMPVFAENGKFSRTRYDQLLKENGLTPAQFEAQLRQGMLLEQLQALPQILASASPQEAQQVWQWSQEYRDVSVLTLHNAQFIAQVHPSAAEIDQYYQAHKAEFQQPAQMQVQYLVLGKKDFADELQFEAQIDNFKNLLFSSPNLQAVAKQYHLTPEQSGLLEEGKAGTGVFAEPAAVKLAFSAAVRAGKNSSALRLANGDLLALHLMHYQPAQTRSLQAVETQVRSAVLQQQAAKMRLVEAKQLLATARKEQSIASWQKEYSAELVHYPEISRREAHGLLSPLLQKIFLAAAPASGKVTVGSLEDTSASTLYAVAGVVLPSPDLLNPSVRDEIQKSLAEQRLRLLSRAYLQALRDQGKVKIYQSNLQQAIG
ncbi:peptidylprolyl isomerase [Acidithiobacillus sp. CV18-2]|uniref:Peptidylprolyl isomerase n=1 Tax=Igneacidithiobacillus copahuensis TaxID=2724909 RepID=A0AAE2YN09_9PROT|nr:peptidylprolyl isomerase [Igneacidithiobacillus copahuensis]MBU2754257.1 peptidylprolyl isomerase [Acidithiobacillus sp. CV18-3]MBU2755944.1 peptidylprolyl isomerase [Acidithiobacillus sp. BN09-2]MBU2778144.1 peptidylprolyl isomerase [Acidithiobacillus sp. CV18-2]MBU2796504.1 peptidylprolyl isomerase [Acidithiobacillus sp. VAN18-2]MBU2800130.1 peptidylprolyl isomerase [Acidithiobacillus sp. VAN18-4]UTV80014.1 peptidylprolyl isomerase [Acidithiobacillus sp. YTS05]